MNFKVTYSNNYNYNVKVSIPQSFKVDYSSAKTDMPQNLSDLLDVELSGSPDKYVLMYDASTQKWRNVNPDEVLISATLDQTPGYVGIPTVFENQLDIDLDNRIDLDAGGF